MYNLFLFNKHLHNNLLYVEVKDFIDVIRLVKFEFCHNLLLSKLSSALLDVVSNFF